MALIACAVFAAACGGEKAAFGDGGSANEAVFANSPACNVLDAYLSSNASETGKVQGYSFAIFDQTQTLLTCSGGNQNIDSILPIASASKLPSAVAIMSLVDSNQLNLDLPVSLYLAGSGVNWPLDKQPITMRMLLAHTSGLPGLGMDDMPVECLESLRPTTLQNCVVQIAATPLAATPGQVFNYGAADYQVAGYIATLIANQSWQDFFMSSLGTPLALKTFSYGDPVNVRNPRIAGGGISDVADYVAILQMILSQGRAGNLTVLSASSVNTLLTDQIAGKPKQYTPSDAALYPGYTFGFFISDSSLHPGSAGPEFSDPGLFGTTPWIDQDLGYGAVLLINKDTATGLAMWDTVRPLIIAALKSP